MPPSRRGEGLVVGVTVIGSVTVLEDTDVRMVPPAMVVVDITAVVDVGETAGLVNVGIETVCMMRILYLYCVVLYLM